MFDFIFKEGNSHILDSMEDVIILALKSARLKIDFEVVSRETGEVLIEMEGENVKWVSNSIKYVF